MVIFNYKLQQRWWQSRKWLFNETVSRLSPWDWKQEMLYVVGKFIPWGNQKFHVTRVKVSFEGVTALLHMVTVTCMPKFHRNSCVTSKLVILRVTFTALLHNNWMFTCREVYLQQINLIMKWPYPVEVNSWPILGKILLKNCCYLSKTKSDHRLWMIN